MKLDPSCKTPAFLKQDGVDYIPMPTWKIFMIQFLNIAGLGPIFGAIMGAKFGTASFLWIVLGSIFAGAVHDFIILSSQHHNCDGRTLVRSTLHIGQGFHEDQTACHSTYAVL